MLKKETISFIKKAYSKESYQINPTCYCYDLSIINNNLEALENHCPKEISLYYAMKANNNPDIMKIISNHPYVKGIEIASSGELDQAHNYYDYKNIIFTGPGKTKYELEQSIKNGIRLINVESITEATRINNIAKKLNIPKVDILIRINLNYSIEGECELMSGRSTKLGIDEPDYVESYKFINNLEHINIKGIHVFAASGVIDYQDLLKSNRYIFDLVKRTEPETGPISIIDFGGGLGIDYTNQNRLFDLENYCLILKDLIKEFNFNNKEIIMELGTYIVGNAGYYTAQIIDIKKVKGKKHIIIAGGINHMGLPLEMQRKQPVCIIPMNIPKLHENQVSVFKEEVDISGPLCLDNDKLSWDEYIEHAQIGDIVVYLQSGAYCYAEGMHKFLSHMPPNELIIPFNK